MNREEEKEEEKEKEGEHYEIKPYESALSFTLEETVTLECQSEEVEDKAPMCMDSYCRPGYHLMDGECVSK